LFKLIDAFGAGGEGGQIPVLITGFVAAAITGFVCIWGLMRYLQKGRLYPFALYCVWFGVSSFVVALIR
jgi:undecaprenyl-diphosphatase